MKKTIFPLFVLVIVLTVALSVFAAPESDGEKSAKLDITGANLVFSEDVYLLFAVDIENAPHDEVELLIFRGEGTKASSCIKGQETASLRTSGKTVNSGKVNGYVFEYTDIAACEYTENIYARAYYKDGDDEYYSEVLKYSVLQYACNKLGITGTPTKDTKLKVMIENMLLYGAAAQQYFEINENRLATDSYVKYNLEGALLEDGMSYGLYKKGEKFSAVANKDSSKPHVMWTDSNGSSVSTGDSITVTAERNRTLVASRQEEEPTFGSYKYVVIIGVDGAGSFYPEETDTPNLDRIFGNRAITYRMRVTSPSSSSVSWMSALHGVPPENHGNLENSTVENGIPYTMDSKYPSILRVVKEARPKDEVACFYAWIGIDGIVESGAGINKQKKSDAVIVDYLESGYLSRSKPTLTYLHFNLPDSVGHNIGHHTPEYYASIETIDGYIGRIYNAYKNAGMAEDTLFIVTSDHGGINKTHGGLHDTEKYSIFAASGKNVTNTAIEDMNIRDTAAVVLHALGIEMPATYTSMVPTGIFGDVTRGERFEYHDPDSPRYHIPTATPISTDDSYVTNYISKKLITYLPFDGTTSDLYGREVKENGIITYEDGYFGKGVRLDDGYLNIKDFKIGTGSYTISMWIKSSTPTNGYSPIITNKRMSSGADGFVFALGRYSSVEGYDHYGFFNVAKGGSVGIKQNMPKDYIYGWMHITLVIDRENGLLRLAYDFGDFYTVDLPHSISASSSLNTAYDYLTIGEAPDGNADYKSGVAIDELMIFEGAFDTDDMRALVEYFGRDKEIADMPDVSDSFGENKIPEVYLGFESNAGNGGASGVIIGKTNTLTYTDGKVGDCVFLDNASSVTVDALSLGVDSFSLAAWIYPTDLEPSSARKRIPIISNAAGSDSGNYGFNLMIDTEEEKLVATIGKAGSGVEVSADFPRSYYELKWTHVAAVFDRSNMRLILYVDFKKVKDEPLVYKGTSTPLDSTLSSDTSHPIRLGGFGNYYNRAPLLSYIDDVMIFKRAITDSDIIKMKDFYKNPLSVYVDVKPTLDFGFNGEGENRADYNGAILENGNIDYCDGYIGLGASFANGSVEIPELDLGYKNSFTVSFFMSTDSLGYKEGEPRYLPIFSNGTEENGDGGSFSILLDKKSGGVLVRASNSAHDVGYAFASYDGIFKADTWMHVAVVVNRSPESGREYLEIYLDYKKAVIEEENLYAFGSFDFNGPEGYTPHIGRGGKSDSLDLYTERLDEFMFFEEALTPSEINLLKSYYRQ